MNYQKLQTSDTNKLKQLLKLYSDVFKEPENYQNKVATDDYLQKFLADEAHIVLVVTNNDKVIGGLVAYVLNKFEQERKEIFVYDLAIATQHQRKGLGTGLFKELRLIAKQIGAYSIFVEAEQEDKHAVSFYRKLNVNEEIDAQHFTIEV